MNKKYIIFFALLFLILLFVVCYKMSYLLVPRSRDINIAYEVLDLPVLH